MMAPFDGPGVPPNGQVAPPTLARPPPMQPNQPNQGMHQHQGAGGPMNHPGGPYGHGGHRGTMQQMHYGMPPSPAGRQANYGSARAMHAANQFSGHPPLHSPHQGGPPGMPPHPGMHQLHRNTSSTMPTQQQPQMRGGGMPPMGPMDQMRSNSNNSHSTRGHYGMDNSNNMGGSGRGSGSGGGGAPAGSWQSDKDTPHRREMIQQIVKLLKKDKGGSPDSANKLPQMAKQLEVSLYRNARSFEAYMDMSTLKQRLQQIAVEVSRKARHQNDPPRGGGHPDFDRRQRPMDPTMNGMNNPMSGSTSPFGNGRANGMGQMVDMGDINPSMGMNGMNGRQSNSAPMNFGGNRQPVQPAFQAGGKRSDPELKIKIRHKQQRLLLLHHSAKCTAEEGRCNVTPHCSDMKRLWRHMEGCKDNNCRIPHCFSSRAILSHYRKCKEASCPACGPVRETVKKSRASSNSQSSRLSQSSTSSNTPVISNVHNMPMNGGPPLHMNASADPLSMSGNSGTFPPLDPMNDAASFNQSSMSSSSASSRVRMPPPGSGRSNNVQLSPNHFPVQNAPPLQPLYGSDRSLNDGRVSSRSELSTDPLQRSNGGGGGDPLSSSSRSAGGDPMSTSRSSQQNGANNDLTCQPASSSRSSSGNPRNESEWQKIRHKQQRLLLLRHASRCQYEAGKCPTTPHCANMKQLWEHIAHCKNQQCQVQHCLSSRYVLSHYRRCKDSRCPACGPVRETIRKSHEREKSNGTRPPSSGHRSFDSIGREESSPTTSSSPINEPQPKRTKLDHPSPQPEIPPASESPIAPESAPPVPPSSDISAGPPGPLPPPTPSPPMSVPSQAVPEADSHKSDEVKTLSKAPTPTPSAPDQVSSQKIKIDPSSAKDSKFASKAAKAPGEDRSLLESFTVKELQAHLSFLERKATLPQTKIKSKCSEVLKGLQTHQHGWVFNTPVDPVELGLPDYFEIIKKPMDLGTIQKKLDTGSYHAIEEFAADVYLTFDNAMTYNEDGSVVWGMAKELKAKFEIDMKKLNAQLEADDKAKRQDDRACMLCGAEKRLFEPPVYFCNGMNCQSQRIRRNSHFYIGGNNQYFWCSSCFNELDDKIPIELVDMTIMKSDLKKKKNDEVHEESWVQCDTCQRWVHQICGLFNTRQNKEHHSVYNCPKCLCEKREENVTAPIPAKPPGAEDLPRTTLSEWLEQQIKKKVMKRKRELAAEKAEIEGISLEEATRQVESGGNVIVRQVTSVNRTLEVRELMKKRYAHKNYPDEFPFRCKCLLVFQQLDGVDVVLFALYVYEHDEKNPAPNQRVVYISYLDSVHFMRPRKLRTFVYHEILIAYLDYARRKGYSTAHIWACPPLKGDDYIFYAKPEDQKTPRDSRLRQWYIDMLIEAQKRSIVGKVTNMHDLYFSDEKLDATSVPYLEGDYFPGEVENIIKMLEEGGGKKGGGAGKKKKSKVNKSKGNTGTRSSGLDEAALIDSGAFEGVRNLKDLDRDQVMVKMGETILPMKDSFIVAFLNWSGAREEDMAVPEEVEKARLEYNGKDESDLAGSKRDAIGNVRDLIGSNQGVKIIDDDDEDLDCEFLNNRQAFLNLCRGNHYQFDELRRAKHTSMMVLWHLHNREAPKFVQQCVSCNREILSGKRYHCNTCQDYDLCQDCYKDPKANRGACTHELQAIAVEPDVSKERSGVSEEERKQRQRNLMLHIQLIEHASRCQSKSCSSTNCAKMKNYLQHARVCPTKVQGGCRVCKRIWTLLRIHAQKCKDNSCRIPQCNAIREKMRQLQKQQQAMDDRRRLEMNRHMRYSVTGGS